MDTYKIQKMATRVHMVCVRHNPNNYKGLGMDEQGDMCVRIARAIIITQEDMNDEDNS